MPRSIDCWVNTNMGDAVPPARCVKEIEELPQRDGILDRFLLENANRLFFQKGTS